MPWYIYAFITPALYSITNFIEKFLIEKKIKNPLALLVVTALITPVLGFVVLVARNFPVLDYGSVIILIVAGIFLKFYLVPYILALKLEDASRVVPLFQLIPIFVLLLAWVFLDEKLSTLQIAGVIIVVAGGMLLGSKKGGRLFQFRKAYWYMILSGFIYAGILVVLRSRLINYSMWDILGYEYLGNGLGGFLLLLVPSIRKSFFQEFGQIKSITGYILVNEILAIIALLSEATAIAMVQVAFVSIIEGVQPLFLLVYGIILSIWFPQIIKEDTRKNTIIMKVISILLMLIGLAMVNFL